jgi:HD superfamily phosphodiesterase
MKTEKYMDKNEIARKGVQVLLKELGPIETRRFIELSRVTHEDSIRRHRKWQKSLDTEKFLKEIFPDL